MHMTSTYVFITVCQKHYVFVLLAPFWIKLHQNYDVTQRRTSQQSTIAQLVCACMCNPYVCLYSYKYCIRKKSVICIQTTKRLLELVRHSRVEYSCHYVFFCASLNRQMITAVYNNIMGVI